MPTNEAENGEFVESSDPDWDTFSISRSVAKVLNGIRITTLPSLFTIQEFEKDIFPSLSGNKNYTSHGVGEILISALDKNYIPMRNKNQDPSHHQSENKKKKPRKIIQVYEDSREEDSKEVDFKEPMTKKTKNTNIKWDSESVDVLVECIAKTPRKNGKMDWTQIHKAYTFSDKVKLKVELPQIKNKGQLLEKAKNHGQELGKGKNQGNLSLHGIILFITVLN